jgi:hypothetical protein
MKSLISPDMIALMLIFLGALCWPDKPAKNPEKKASPKNPTGPQPGRKP